MPAPTEVYVDPSLQSRTAVAGITNTITTAHVNQPGHGYLTNDIVKIHGSTRTEYNGIFPITVNDANNYDYTMLSTPPGPATGTPRASKMTGSGTVGNPYNDLQHALNTKVRDSTNGDRFNLKAGTEEILTKALTLLPNYGSPTIQAPLVLQGYTAVAADGGVGAINGTNFSIMSDTNQDDIIFKDLSLYNTGSNVGLLLDDRIFMENVEMYDMTNGAVDFDDNCRIFNCHFRNIGGNGIRVINNSILMFNYFKNQTNVFTNVLNLLSGFRCVVYGNIFSLNGTSNAILITDMTELMIEHNSFLGATGKAIQLVSPNITISGILNNLFEGFSSAIDLVNQAAGTTKLVAYNAIFNSAYNLNEHVVFNRNNVTLGSSPFAKTGSDTFANRVNYFAPTNSGGAYPSWRGADRGAIQTSSAGSVEEQGGGASYVLRGA